MPDHVSDFDISLEVAGETLFAEVSCPLGEGFGAHAWPSAAELARSGRELGEILYDCLLPAGAVRSHYERCRGKISSGGRLRLRIRAAVRATDDDVVRIHAIPWELAHDPAGDDFLALDPQVQVVRYLNLPTAVPDAFRPGVGALKVLVASACPAEYPRLGWEDERAAIARAFADTAVRVTVLPHATRAGLRDLLASEQYDVLHFIGHGGRPTGGRPGMIVLETAHGSADWLTADELAVIAHGAGSLRLVFLNACSTAELVEASHRNLAGSVGPALALRGVPAVVAMASPVFDADAIEFARSCYVRLCAGAPLEAAVHAGRIAVRLRQTRGLSWSIPVVFSRMSANPPVEQRPPVARVEKDVAGAFHDVTARYMEVAARSHAPAATGAVDQCTERVHVGVTARNVTVDTLVIGIDPQRDEGGRR